MSGRVSVEVHGADGAGGAIDPARLEAAVRRVLEELGAADAELSVTLLDDAEISRINREYLSHDGPTDVISFPLTSPGGPVVGDVYIGVDQARRQAEELGVPLREELVRLAVHGTLHVLGHEHPEGDDREGSEMYRLQERLVAEIEGDGEGAGA